MISDNTAERIYTSIILILVLSLIIFFDFILAYVLILIGVLSILEFLQITKKIFKNRILKDLLNFFVITYIFSFCCLFFFFSNFLQTKIILYFILGGCIASDIGGFIFGKTLKGPKITKISPNKTYSGAFGSIIFTCFILFMLFYFFNFDLEMRIIFIAFITSVACQVGDLFFSFLKRKAKIKDTGKILPGHGGLLDRIDGILFGVPIGSLSILFLY